MFPSPTQERKGSDEKGENGRVEDSYDIATSSQNSGI